MALSDEERRRLEKLEQELAASDPDLARKLQSEAPKAREASRIVYGAVTAMAAFGLVIAGIITKLTVIGAVGFLLMIAGAHLFLTGLDRQERTIADPGGKPGDPSAAE